MGRHFPHERHCVRKIFRPYHGNARSKVSHQASCENYDCKNCTAGFSSREEAVAAGYRPWGKCKL